MLRGRQIALIIILFVMPCVTSFGAYKEIYTPRPDDPMPAHIYQLENGLTVFLTENHQEPRFYAEVAVRAGSKNDPAETTGLAHYLEHLMFKGTSRLGTVDFAKEKVHLDKIRDLYEQHFREDDAEKRKQIYEEINRETQLSAQYSIPNELDKIYQLFGATALNAHTSVEETVYQVSLPKNRLEQWAAIESDRFKSPIFRLFITELETVYEEKNRSQDDKERLLIEGVLEKLYKNHPYGQQTTLGTMEHLKRPSIKNIEDFYRRNYVPGNMAVMLSGDFKAGEAIQLIDKYFSEWTKEPLPEKKAWKEEPIKSVERVTIPYPGEPKVMIAFRTAPEGSDDAPVLKLIDMILDNRVAGLINLNLNQAQKVREAGSFPMIMNEEGAQILWGVPKAGQTLEQVEQLLRDQLELIRNGEFEDWILPAIVSDFEKTQKLGLEENRGRVAIMREAFIAEKKWPDALFEIERMKTLTKADVVRVANKYFGNGYVAGHRVDEQRKIPFMEKPKIDRVQIDPSRQSQFLREILAMPVPEIQPKFIDPEKDYAIFRDVDGVKYYYTANPMNDLFSLSVRIEKGLRHDPKLPAAIQLLQKAGTPTLSPGELQKEWYRLGTDFSISAGDNETVISISGLDRNYSASVALLKDVLARPVSDQATLEELVQIILGQREDAKKDQNTVMSAVTQYNRYGKESRFLKMLPAEELKALKAHELLQSVTDLLALKRTVLYTGSLDPLEALPEFMETFAGEKSLQDAPAYQHLEMRKPEKNQIYFFDKELAQSMIRLEFADGTFESNKLPKIELFNDYFDGGMGGLVFQELREARALAYVVGAQYLVPERPIDQNIMIGVIQCQPDKADEAVEGFVSLMDEMPVSKERFEDTTRSLENQYRTAHIGFRAILGSVLGWERLNLPVDPRRQWFGEVLSLKIDDLLEFQKGHIGGQPKIFSIVGDSKKMDMEKLATFGAITTVGLEEIFVD